MTVYMYVWAKKPYLIFWIRYKAEKLRFVNKTITVGQYLPNAVMA